jgi:hypothetical protein
MNLVFASGFLAPQKVLAVDYFRDLPAQYPEALFPRVAVDGGVREAWILDSCCPTICSASQTG